MLACICAIGSSHVYFSRQLTTLMSYSTSKLGERVSYLDGLVGLRQWSTTHFTGQTLPDHHHSPFALLTDQMPCTLLTPLVSPTALSAGLCALPIGTSTTSPSSETQCPATWVSGGTSREGQHGKHPCMSVTEGPQPLKSCPAAIQVMTGLAAH